MHDVAEVFTGDVPAPFKWDNPDIAQGLRDGEMAYMNMHAIPWAMLKDEERKLLKVADMLDLVLSSMEEIKRGNTNAKELVSNGERYLREMKLPEDLWEKVEIMVSEVKYGRTA